MERIRFGRDICGDLSAVAQREWLETNGLGGFASSTIAGWNTRRYHALLTAAIKPPAARAVLLSKFEEAVIVNGRRYELSVNRYPGVIHPQGHQYLREFRLDPFPTFAYEVEDLTIEKRVFLVHGENTVVVEYELTGGCGNCTLELRPLIAFRDFHSTAHRNDALDSRVVLEPGVATTAPYEGMPALHFAHDATEVRTTGDWYFHCEYDVERERGLDFEEDLFNPFAATFALGEKGSATIIASTSRHAAADAAALRTCELSRRSAIIAASPSEDPLIQELTAAADQFLAVRGEYKTIIAGYHWFGDWGRDTMIALPGITLVTGRYDAARSILLAFADSLSEGMLPNWFPGSGETPEYNTVDATLWFFEAFRAYAKYSGDMPFVRNLYGKLKDIIDWHLRGTRYGIRVESDGLLAAGEPGVQLTWMDSKIGDWVVTPRTGKPVEIQALWYNALSIMANFACEFDDAPARLFFTELAAHAKSNFNAKFWNAGEGCLYDVVGPDGPDAAIRPNQIFAVSLTHSMLAPDRAWRVVETVQRELLTPLGLRSLSPRDSRYRRAYEGGVRERDSAYHQGTVWPWLMGPFLSAYIAVHGRTPQARREAYQMLQPIREHMRTAGLGHISEIADASTPHQPRGCIAQAWSVAETLRAAVEDVLAEEVPARGLAITAA